MRALATSLVLVLTTCALPAWAQEDAPETSSASEESDWRYLAGGIVMGAGVAAIMAGSTVATVAAAEYADLDCPDDKCPPEIFDDAEDYNALREPSGLTIAFGGVLSAIGGAFLYAAITDRGDTIAIELSPSYFGVRGAF